MIRVLSATSIAFVFLLSAASCSSPSGPIAPMLVPTPNSKVTITPDLADSVGLPDVSTVQITHQTPDGRFQYQFQLQNKSDQHFALTYAATFVDSEGAVVDDQRPQRIYFTPQQIRTVVVTCSNSDGTNVRVQVAPAN